MPCPLSGRVNEYVLWFAEPSDAERAFAQLRRTSRTAAPSRTPRIGSAPPTWPTTRRSHPPVEEQITGEITRVARDGRADGYRNGLSAARIGSLVVVHEWLGAPPTRPALTLYALTMYALERVSPAVAPSRYAEPDQGTS